MGRRSATRCSALCLALVLYCSHASAQYAPNLQPLDSTGYASEAQVDVSVGTRNTRVVCPGERVNGDTGERGVVVTVEKPGVSDPGVLSTLLHDALQTVWDQCEMQIPLGYSHYFITYDVGTVAIYVQTEGGSPELEVQADHYLNAVGRWDVISYAGAERRAQAAQAAQQQPPQEAVVPSPVAPQSVPSGPNTVDIVGTVIGDVFGLFILGLVLWGLYALRVPVARWYYFTFHPHPAEPMVERALLSGSVLDGKALARALGELPPDSSILARVRLEQGEQLVLRMQDASNAKIREYQRRAVKEYERAALIAMQEAVALAAIALEKAKTVFRASQSIGR